MAKKLLLVVLVLSLVVGLTGCASLNKGVLAANALPAAEEAAEIVSAQEEEATVQEAPSAADAPAKSEKEVVQEAVPDMGIVVQDDSSVYNVSEVALTKALRSVGYEGGTFFFIVQDTNPDAVNYGDFEADLEHMIFTSSKMEGFSADEIVHYLLTMYKLQSDGTVPKTGYAEKKQAPVYDIPTAKAANLVDPALAKGILVKAK